MEGDSDIGIIRVSSEGRDLAQSYGVAWHWLGRFDWSPHPLVSIHATEIGSNLVFWRGGIPPNDQRRAWTDSNIWLVGNGAPLIKSLAGRVGRAPSFDGNKVTVLDLLPFGYFAWAQGEADQAVLAVVTEPTSHELLDALHTFHERRAAIGDGFRL